MGDLDDRVELRREAGGGYRSVVSIESDLWLSMLTLSEGTRVISDAKLPLGIVPSNFAEYV